LKKIKSLRDNVFVDDSTLDDIEKQLEGNKITEAEAYEQLRKLDPEYSPKSFFLSKDHFDDDWKTLVDAIDEAEQRANKLASSQFLLGLMGLPIFVVIVLMSFMMLNLSQYGSSAVLITFLVGCLSAIAAHSYFVLRIHQQASLAAERLCEKRMGILFLKISAIQKDFNVSEKLIDSGTKMFLGHHVAQTIPLQKDDYAVTKMNKK
jgi:hypothetical protein